MEPTEDNQQLTQALQKKERSNAQKLALEAARARAFKVRQENAELRRKEKEIDKQTQEEVKQARKAKVEMEYKQITKPKEEPPKEETKQEEEEVEYVKAPKKTKKRRVVVVQDSSSEEEVEVVLPKQKRAKEAEVDPEYSRMYDKLFSMH